MKYSKKELKAGITRWVKEINEQCTAEVLDIFFDTVEEEELEGPDVIFELTVTTDKGKACWYVVEDEIVSKDGIEDIVNEMFETYRIIHKIDLGGLYND